MHKKDMAVKGVTKPASTSYFPKYHHFPELKMHVKRNIGTDYFIKRKYVYGRRAAEVEIF